VEEREILTALRTRIKNGPPNSFVSDEVGILS